MKTTFKIIKDTEWNEYQVQVFENGNLNEERTYHTDNQLDAISTFKAVVDEQKKNESTHQKIDPDTDTLESALIKKGISPKVTKAILSGYEGIFLLSPISISLNSKESFYGRDLLIKTIMVFEENYTAWNNDLFSIHNNSNKEKVQSLLNETK